MKYVRTNKGIYKVGLWSLYPRTNDKVQGYYVVVGKNDTIPWSEIIKQADTIEELIMPGDLVRVGLTMVLVEKARGDELRGIDLGLIKRNAVEELWLGKEDEKKFIKCATKEEGDDYLTLCD